MDLRTKSEQKLPTILSSKHIDSLNSTIVNTHGHMNIQQSPEFMRRDTPYFSGAQNEIDDE